MDAHVMVDACMGTSQGLRTMRVAIKYHTRSKETQSVIDARICLRHYKKVQSDQHSTAPTGAMGLAAQRLALGDVRACSYTLKMPYLPWTELLQHWTRSGLLPGL